METTMLTNKFQQLLHEIQQNEKITLHYRTRVWEKHPGIVSKIGKNSAENLQLQKS